MSLILQAKLFILNFLVIKKFYNLFLVGTIVLSQFLITLIASAQDVNNNTLFNSKALLKANQQFKDNNSKHFSSFRKEGIINGLFNAGLTEAFNLELVSEIAEDEISGGSFFSDYQATFYQEYNNDFSHLNELEDILSDSFAKRALVYQSVSYFTSLLRKSALEPVYRSFVKNIKEFKNHTTMKVNKNGAGNLEVMSSESTEEHLFKLKLHFSANSWVEPRLEIGQNWLFRYDVLNQDTVVEYKTNF